MRYLILLAMTFSAHAAEPWQSVLILNEYESVADLLKSCEFKGTVAVSGQVSRLTQELAEETLKLGGNTVQLSRAVDSTILGIAGRRAALNGRAFLCER